jgi:hypothetical protein
VTAVLGSVGEDWKPRIMLGCSVTTRGPEGCSWSELSARRKQPATASQRFDVIEITAFAKGGGAREDRTARPLAGAPILALDRKPNPQPRLTQRGLFLPAGLDRASFWKMNLSLSAGLPPIAAGPPN